MKQVKTVEVLVATMNQVEYETLPSYLNLQTNAIIGNQCNRNEIVETFYQNNSIKWLNFKERGVGKNRNNALMRSTADIVVFSDDDMIFDNGYEETVLRVFNENPEADIIIFNIKGDDGRKRKMTQIKRFTNKTFYGAARIAARRDKLFKYNLFFNLCFGGGTEYSCGEDSLFLSNCKWRGLKILLVPDSIATLQMGRVSSWYQGPTDKFYRDKGSLFAATKISFPYLRMIKSAYMASKNDCKRSFKYLFFLYVEGYKKYRNR